MINIKSFLILFFVAFISFLAFQSFNYRNENTSTDNSIFDLRIFRFTPIESKILPGLSTEKASSYNCSGVILDDDKIGDLAIVAQFYQNGCYTDGRYNHKNFKVEKGVVSDSKKEFSFDAYRVNEPSNKASKFLASIHCIAYKFQSKENYTVYELDGSKINKIIEIPKSDITIGKYTTIKDIGLSTISGSSTYFFAPSNVRISIYKQFSNTVEGAMVKETDITKVYKYRYQSAYTPFDTQLDRYTNTRQSFLLLKNNSKASIIWQDKENQSIILTRFGKDFKTEISIKLPNSKGAKLVAATNDNYDNFYYLVVQDESKNSETAVVTLFKTNSNGALIKKSRPESSKKGLNIYHFGNYMADLQFMNGKLALFIARTMFASSDGLNHQGGIAVIFDANSLEVTRNFGQTSGHSFDNYLTTNSKNEFIGIDLGDNYPRGINLHKFNNTQIKSKIVYTFKTKHGSRAKSPAGKTYPYYSEISNSNNKYYKWSNDNGTYSSLGALIEVNDGYIVVFTGEPDPNGKSINNARVGDKNSDPRNIGFIKLVKDFETKSGRGNVVSDDMVLSKGLSESGGFFTFGGRWAEQRNTGVQWLTNYKNVRTSTATNLKAVKLINGNILLLWEKETIKGYQKDYISTNAMIIDGNGKRLKGPVDLGSHVRLNRRDEPLVIDNKVLLSSGSKLEKKLELLVLEIK